MPSYSIQVNIVGFAVIDRKVVVFSGPKLRVPGKGKGGHQEFDFVVVDLELKAIIGIESKATLNAKTGQSAAAQTQRDVERIAGAVFWTQAVHQRLVLCFHGLLQQLCPQAACLSHLLTLHHPWGQPAGLQAYQS